MQTLLISFQRGSPPVESAHRRPNPCSEPRAIPSLEGEGITPTHNKVSLASFVHGRAN